MKPALLIFDWAGTLVDYGCCAPLVAFIEAFAACGLPIDDATARKPMGASKRDHVREILAEPAISSRVRRELGIEPDEALGDRLYAAFQERLLEMLPRYAAPIPGAVEAVQQLRAAGWAIGSTTGYTRAMMQRLLPSAAEAGLAVDALICSDEVPQGRPAPWACFRLAERFGIYPLSRALKIGDTPADMAEGQNAGMRCVGISASGNEVGLSQEQLAQRSPLARRELLARAEERLRAAGAEVVLSSVAELPAWIAGAAE
ncbi:MAG: phosphonoacetaldehyde hydrolase [Planctomycetes bacterium]|nr:phosphonoacetaldehyde hydrolase [Planctomycetota bacterium]